MDSKLYYHYIYIHMINIIPRFLYFLTAATLPPIILLIHMNHSIIIEWEITSILRTAIKLEIILEWRRILFSIIVLFISRNVLKFSKEYIKNDLNNLRFTYLVLIFVISINMLIYIPNILCLLIGWDGLGITSFILIIYYNNPRSLRAGILTIITNRLGDVFLLISIRITMNTGEFLPIFHLVTNKYFFYQWFGILVAAITKRAQLPFSSWLPAAIAAPTPVSALVHSSTLVTAGIFILYRFNIIITHSKIIQLIIIISRILTILTAGTMAIYENDIKKIIALSTLSQLGLIAIPITINIPILRFFHIAAHAIFKALLFISAGTLIIQNDHKQDIRLFGSFSKLTPLTSSSIIISSIALIGIPFITGYYSKHKIIEWSSRIYINLIIYTILILIIALTSIYSTRLLIFIIILPIKKSTTMKQIRSNNNNTPIITMSLIRIWVGRIIQWLSPIKEIHLLINENLKQAIPNIIILFSTILAISIITFTHKNKKHSTTNKLFTSIIFITPISTQFILPAYFNLSLSLYKYLDQSWLEKLLRLGLPNRLLNLSLHNNLLLPKYPQNTLLNSIISRIIIIRLLILC